MVAITPADETGPANGVHTPGAPVWFSTRGLPEARRIELWESHNAASLIGLRCRMLGPSSLEATEVNLQLEHLHLAYVEGNPHVVERSAEVIRSSPTDSVALYFTLVGEAFFYHEDGVSTVRPGQMLMCDVDRPFMRGFSHGLEELAVKIPKAVLLEIGGAVPATPVVIDFSRSRDTNAYAHTLANTVASSVGPRAGGRANEDAILDLVAALIDRGPDRMASTHYAAAEAYIRKWLRDPNLSAVRIAGGIGVSERHLSRVFAEMGTSVPRYVQRRRVELSHRMLQLPAFAAETVEAIAARCGFRSAGQFSRVYREHIGMTPSEIRRQALAGRAGS
jgi:AraC-like DNA-binding protein